MKQQGVRTALAAGLHEELPCGAVAIVVPADPAAEVREALVSNGMMMRLEVGGGVPMRLSVFGGRLLGRGLRMVWRGLSRLS